MSQATSYIKLTLNAKCNSFIELFAITPSLLSLFILVTRFQVTFYCHSKRFLNFGMPKCHYDIASHCFYCWG